MVKTKYIPARKKTDKQNFKKCTPCHYFQSSVNMIKINVQKNIYFPPKLKALKTKSI